jgi:hypothetical protein
MHRRKKPLFKLATGIELAALALLPAQTARPQSRLARAPASMALAAAHNVNSKIPAACSDTGCARDTRSQRRTWNGRDP